MPVGEAGEETGLVADLHRHTPPQPSAKFTMMRLNNADNMSSTLLSLASELQCEVTSHSGGEYRPWLTGTQHRRSKHVRVPMCPAPRKVTLLREDGQQPHMSSGELSCGSSADHLIISGTVSDMLTSSPPPQRANCPPPCLTRDDGGTRRPK